MWCKCVSKYGICDINTIVNIKDSFTTCIAEEMSHIYNICIHICKHHIRIRVNTNNYYAVHAQVTASQVSHTLVIPAGHVDVAR